MHSSNSLQSENDLTLVLVQALLGAISPNFRAISLQLTDGTVHLHFILEQEDSTDREEIEDVVAEFEALSERPVLIEVHIRVLHAPWPAGVGSLKGRAVYVRRGM